MRKMPDSEYYSPLFRDKILPMFCARLKSISTQYNYLLAVANMCDYMKKDFLAVTPEDAESYFVRLYNGEIKARNGQVRSDSGISFDLARFRSIGNFILMHLDEYGISYTNPFVYLDLPELSPYVKPQSVPSVYSLDDILYWAGRSQMGVIFSLVIKCGLSSRDLLALSPKTFAVDQNDRLFIHFTLRGPEKKERYIKIPGDIEPLILDWLSMVPPDAESIFHDSHGNPMSYITLQRSVRKFMDGRGLDGVSLRDLRHAAAAQMLHDGAAPTMVAKQLGIKNVQWLTRYDRVVEELDYQASDDVKLKVLTSALDRAPGVLEKHTGEPVKIDNN